MATRTRLLALFLLLSTLVLGALVAGDMRALIGRPFPPFPVLPHGVVSVAVLSPARLVANEPRLRPPWTVVAVDGVPVRGGRDVWRAVEAAGAGAELTWDFVRRGSGETLRTTLPVPVFTEADFRDVYVPVALSSLVLLAVGSAPILLRPSMLAARLVFAFAISIASGLGLLAFDYAYGYRFVPWLRITMSVGAAAMLHLGLYFPEPRWPLARWPRATAATIWGSALALFALHLVSYFALPALAFSVDRIQILLFIAACVILGVNCALTAWRSPDPLRRQQAIVVLPGPILYCFAALRAALSAYEMTNYRFTLFVPLPATVMALSLAYAMLKHNVFEFDAVVRRGLALGIVGVSGAAVAMLVFVGFHTWLGVDSGWIAVGATTAMLLLVLPAVVPLWRRLEGFIEATLFPHQRRARQVIRDASRELARARDLDGVARFLRDVVRDSVGGEPLRIVAGAPDQPLGEIGGELVLPPADPLYVAFRRGFTVNAVGVAGPASRAAVQRAQGLGVHLAVALPPRDALLGGLLLGPRRDGRLYTPDDEALLETLAAQAAVAIENARVWDEMHALERRLAAENVYLREEIALEHDVTEIVGRTEAIRTVVGRIKQVAPTDAAVLVTGETGTGKELVVRAIHALSKRADRMLVKIACAAVPEALLESELFGHERGAFTGAHERRIGRFELADGGTIFFDDVDTLPLGVQAKLLRALQEGEVQRLGNPRVRQVDVRVIAATNRDLLAEVRAGRFREDLYYRLDVVPIRIPPLRERRDDVPLLVEHFLEREGARLGRSVRGVAADALAEMQAYGWPGNVRELRNVIQRALVLGPDDDVLRLPAPLADATIPTAGAETGLGSASFAELVRRYKTGLVSQALAQAGGNQREAAELLGLHRPSLTRMLRDLGLRDAGGGKKAAAGGRSS